VDAKERHLAARAGGEEAGEIVVWDLERNRERARLASAATSLESLAVRRYRARNPGRFDEIDSDSKHHSRHRSGRACPATRDCLTTPNAIIASRRRFRVVP